MRRQTWWLWCGLAALTVASCGSDPRSDMAVLGLPIINGEPDTSSAHQAVVYIQGNLGNGTGFACTGTLVTPDVVLTAAHCVCEEQSTTQLSVNQLKVGFGDHCGYFNCPLTWRDVAEVQHHPQYDATYVINDIALIRLSQPAPAEVQPIPFLPEHLAIGTDDVEAPIEFVGFGQTETGAVGTKMHFTGQVKWICDGPDYCRHARGVYGAPHTLCFDQALGGTCQGDSGGPALFERDGQVYVAAVTSYGDTEGCTLYGCSTKVDGFEDFLSDFIGGSLGTACSADAECGLGHCVDGICCDSACDAACMSCTEPGHEGRCTAASNGAPCSDGDPCNGDEVCLMGDCVPGTPLDCADDDPCTEDLCQPGAGCRHDPRPVGYPCGDCMMCQDGSCIDADCGSGGCSVAGRPAGGQLGALLALGLFGLLGWAVRRGI